MESGKTWEGQTIAGKFPLRQWLGNSDHSVVFLTEISAPEPRAAAVKLIPVENFAGGQFNEDAQLARWAESAKLVHPNLIRLFKSGHCQVNDNHFLYVVTEYAEENLAQILPLRALSTDEASQMLPAVADALAFLHRSEFVHGHMKPSNIMAIGDRLKISGDSLRRTGEPAEKNRGAYDAPEALTALSPSSDLWSLGAVLAAVLTQREPATNGNGGVRIESIPLPFREIVRECMREHPEDRAALTDIPAMLAGRPRASTPAIQPAEAEAPATKPRWVIPAIIVFVLLVGVLFGRRFFSPSTSAPSSASNTASQQLQTTQPPTQAPTPPAIGISKATVLQKITPEVSRGAQRTVHGRIKVEVRLSVDAAGNVSQAKLLSAGPSKYFADQALAAARQWKFTPARANGDAVPSEWLLRFHFGRTSTQVLPTETKP